jgi:DNA-binding CsgD family transcriptional regulator/PAS domain-containing protein
MLQPGGTRKPQFDSGKLPGLIDAFYEAAARPELWQSALAQFSDALGAAGCGLLGGPASTLAPICTASMEEALDIGLSSGWLAKNPRMERGLEAFRRGHDIVTEATLFTPWELDHLPFNAEYVARVKGRWFADFVLAGDGPSSLVLTTQRLVGSEPFSPSELDSLRRVVPHLRRAGTLALRLAEAHHEGMLDAFAAFDCGALLLDAKGRVIRLNAKAESLLSPGLALRFGHLSAVNNQCNAALQALIDAVIASDSDAQTRAIDAVTVTWANTLPRILYAVPVVRSARHLFVHAAAVLMIACPVAGDGPLEHFLQGAFRFTGAEAAIAVSLCNGHQVDEIARMRGVSQSTVRAQVKSMLAKTSTRRQAELVALLVHCAPMSR